MGFERHGTFERAEEWKSARLGDIEYEQMARALKALALEKGVAIGPVLDSLAHAGLGAALAVIAGVAGPEVASGYYRCRNAQGPH